MRQKLKDFIKTYPHVWTIGYFLIYLPWFICLERRDIPYHVVHAPLDDYIPFCEYFIVPYLLWFLYIAVVFAYLFFRDRTNYGKYIIFLYTGMTLFLIVSTFYPNGHLLRPLEFDRDSIFIQLVCFIYWADTSTNILPSIHVFNSIATHMAIMNTPSLNTKRWTVWGSRILCVSIILSTMFLKQHSCVDVFLGTILGFAMNYLVYQSDFLVKAHYFVGKLVGQNRDLSPAFSRKVHRPAKDTKI